MKQLQFRINHYIFRPSFIGTLFVLMCTLLFIKLGFWQYHKAQQKQILLTAYNQANVNGALKFPINTVNGQVQNSEDWKYKKITVLGVYDTKYQFLLDNQVEGDRVGYHVITPLKIDTTSEIVLVDRGWILGNDIHTDIPSFSTPEGKQIITGYAWLPSKKIFTLEDQTLISGLEKKPWEIVWQNMDMDKYKRNVPFVVSDLVIKLDKSSSAGGFVRNWQISSDRITTNLGYAYQWFGFAFASVLIYLYLSITKIKSEHNIVKLND